MKSKEQKAEEYAIKFFPPKENSDPNAALRHTLEEVYLAGYNEAKRWINTEEELPPLLPHHDYSEPVLAKVKDCNDLQVMCLLFVPGDDEDEDGGREYSYMWGNCYGDINGDPYLDDNYDVIAWRPIE